MPFTAAMIMTRALVTLNDAGAVRWPAPELLRALNDGLREIGTVAPEALAKVAYVKLRGGTLQTLPAHILQIIRVNCNVSGTAVTADNRTTLSAVTTRGRVVTPVKKQTLDANEPRWQSPGVWPSQPEISHFVEDSVVKDAFLVAPAAQAGATQGAGWIEVVAAVDPVPVPLPADLLNLAAYGAEVDLDDRYQNALLDFILHRAFSKEINAPMAAQRAVAHYQAFLTGLGVSEQKRQMYAPSGNMGPEPRPVG